MQGGKTRVLFPIGAKLVIIISILLLVSLGAVTLIVSVLSSQDVQRTAEDNNYTVNRRAGSQAEGSFQSVQAAALLYLEMMESSSDSHKSDDGILRFFYSHNQNIALMAVDGIFSGTLNGQPVYHNMVLPNERFFQTYNIDMDTVNEYFSGQFISVPGQMLIHNASPNFQFPLLAAVFNRQGRSGNETVKVLFYPDDLSESFGTGTNTSFIISDSGDVLLHPEIDLVVGGANFSTMPIVEILLKEGDSSRQVSYTDADGVEYFGAYYHIGGTDAIAITTIPYDIVFEAVRSMTLQNLLLTAAVLFIAIMFIWFFSKTISSPVRALADAALKIEGGDFGIDLRPRTKDELGLLTSSFGKMSTALNIFGRFTNRDIAVRAMRGEIKPGGIPQHATIFFSDIRGFTSKTESFTHAFGDEAANRTVMWLNQYLAHMVSCVEKTNGIVDKFIGDAVMAHWGTATTAGSPAEDAYNCVKSALIMRDELIALNSRRAKNDPGDPEIKIGCGINTGRVIVGQIGSEERMEYTVIGDPVNLANRTEALNKPWGTDILITENTWVLISDRFITEEMPPVMVKGKTKQVRMFAVINERDAPGPKTLEELRELLGVPAPDLKKVNADAEEKKYSIPGF